MKKVPNKIYLQTGCPLDEDDDFDMLHGVTWCADRINKDDIVYVRYFTLKERINRIENYLSDKVRWFVTNGNKI